VAKLTAMLDKARRLVAGQPVITCRQDAMEAIEAVRQVVEDYPWSAAGGEGSDLKNLIARLELCERAGGLEHQASVRQLAETMGCARATVEASNRRLDAAGWLVLIKSGSGKLHGSVWTLKIPVSGRMQDFSGRGCDLSAEIFRAAVHDAPGALVASVSDWLPHSAEPCRGKRWGQRLTRLRTARTARPNRTDSVTRDAISM
jgi:hypothetical protein